MGERGERMKDEEMVGVGRRDEEASCQASQYLEKQGPARSWRRTLWRAAAAGAWRTAHDSAGVLAALGGSVIVPVSAS